LRCQPNLAFIEYFDWQKSVAKVRSSARTFDTGRSNIMNIYRFYSIEETKRWLVEVGFRDITMVREAIASRYRFQRLPLLTATDSLELV
jgi:hypothetical protein